MGFLKSVFKVAAIGVGIVVLGPWLLTVGNMDGIDGYCDD
jgi:hypothetical protein